MLVANIATMELFQEDYRLHTGNYLRVASNSAQIGETLGWHPKADNGTTYSISPGDGESYRVTAISPEGFRACVRYPEKVRC